MTEVEFQSQAVQFLTKLWKEIQSQGIVIEAAWPIDHLCFRVQSVNQYEELKSNFLEYGTLLTEAPVQGRPISTFKLKTPIRFQERLIDVIELPAPKPGKKTIFGFEHFEIVCQESFEELIQRYQHLSLDQSGLSKKINPELEIQLASGAIKFHHQSLEEVIALEKQLAGL